VLGSARLSFSGGDNYVEFESASNYVGRNSSGNMILNAAGGNNVISAVGNTTITQATGAGLFQFNSGYGSVATAYACRAWVNFDGSTGAGTTIRGSGNVSSITHISTGIWQINLTNAMPDTNYAVVGASEGAGMTFTTDSGYGLTTSVIGINVYRGGYFDRSYVYAAVFR
jgi:hypothetical protein